MMDVDSNYCDLCKLSFSSDEEFKEHNWSMLHHKKLDQIKGRNYSHKCDLCVEDLFGLLAFTKHIHSEKHQNKLSKWKYKTTDQAPVTNHNTDSSKDSVIDNSNSCAEGYENQQKDYYSKVTDNSCHRRDYDDQQTDFHKAYSSREDADNSYNQTDYGNQRKGFSKENADNYSNRRGQRKVSFSKEDQNRYPNCRDYNENQHNDYHRKSNRTTTSSGHQQPLRHASFPSSYNHRTYTTSRYQYYNAEYSRQLREEETSSSSHHVEIRSNRRERSRFHQEKVPYKVKVMSDKEYDKFVVKALDFLTSSTQTSTTATSTISQTKTTKVNGLESTSDNSQQRMSNVGDLSNNVAQQDHNTQMASLKILGRIENSSDCEKEAPHDTTIQNDLPGRCDATLARSRTVLRNIRKRQKIDNNSNVTRKSCGKDIESNRGNISSKKALTNNNNNNNCSRSLSTKTLQLLKQTKTVTIPVVDDVSTALKQSVAIDRGLPSVSKSNARKSSIVSLEDWQKKHQLSNNDDDTDDNSTTSKKKRKRKSKNSEPNSPRTKQTESKKKKTKKYKKNSPNPTSDAINSKDHAVPPPTTDCTSAATTITTCTVGPTKDSTISYEHSITTLAVTTTATSTGTKSPTMEFSHLDSAPTGDLSLTPSAVLLSSHACEFKKKDGTYCDVMTTKRFCDYHQRVVNAVELYITKKVKTCSQNTTDAVSLIESPEVSTTTTQKSSYESSLSSQQQRQSKRKRSLSDSVDLSSEESSSTTSINFSRFKSHQKNDSNRQRNSASQSSDTSDTCPSPTRNVKLSRFKYLKSISGAKNVTDLGKIKQLPVNLRKLFDKKHTTNSTPNLCERSQSQSESDSETNSTQDKTFDLPIPNFISSNIAERDLQSEIVKEASKLVEKIQSSDEKDQRLSQSESDSETSFVVHNRFRKSKRLAGLTTTKINKQKPNGPDAAHQQISYHQSNDKNTAHTNSITQPTSSFTSALSFITTSPSIYSVIRKYNSVALLRSHSTPAITCATTTTISSSTSLEVSNIQTSSCAPTTSVFTESSQTSRSLQVVTSTTTVVDVTSSKTPSNGNYMTPSNNNRLVSSNDSSMVPSITTHTTSSINNGLITSTSMAQNNNTTRNSELSNKHTVRCATLASTPITTATTLCSISDAYILSSALSSINSSSQHSESFNDDLNDPQFPMSSIASVSEDVQNLNPTQKPSTRVYSSTLTESTESLADSRLTRGKTSKEQNLSKNVLPEVSTILVPKPLTILSSKVSELNTSCGGHQLSTDVDENMEIFVETTNQQDAIETRFNPLQSGIHLDETAKERLQLLKTKEITFSTKLMKTNTAIERLKADLERLQKESVTYKSQLEDNEKLRIELLNQHKSKDTIEEPSIVCNNATETNELPDSEDVCKSSATIIEETTSNYLTAQSIPPSSSSGLVLDETIDQNIADISFDCDSESEGSFTVSQTSSKDSTFQSAVSSTSFQGNQDMDGVAESVSINTVGSDKENDLKSVAGSEKVIANLKAPVTCMEMIVMLHRKWVLSKDVGVKVQVDDDFIFVATWNPSALIVCDRKNAMNPIVIQKAFTKKVTCLVVGKNSNGKMLYTGTQSGIVHCFTYHTWISERKFSIYHGEILSLHFAFNSLFVGFVNGSIQKIITEENVIDKSFQRMGRKRRGISSMASTTYDGIEFLYTGTKHGKVYMWSTDGNLINIISSGSKNSVIMKLKVISTALYVVNKTRNISAYHVQTGDLLYTIQMKAPFGNCIYHEFTKTCLLSIACNYVIRCYDLMSETQMDLMAPYCKDKSTRSVIIKCHNNKVYIISSRGYLREVSLNRQLDTKLTSKENFVKKYPFIKKRKTVPSRPDDVHCPYCDFGFSSDEKLLSHQSRDTCKICCQCFPYRSKVSGSIVSRHMMLFHEEL